MKYLLLHIFLTLTLIGCVPLPNIQTVFPEIHGKITKSGKPISNAKLLFSEFPDYECIDSQNIVSSDKDGLFKLPQDSKFSLFFHMGDRRYSLNMCVVIEGKTYVGLMYEKMGSPPQSIQIVCEISENSVETKDIFNANEAYKHKVCN